MRTLLLFSSSALLLSACTVGPDYTPPRFDGASSWFSSERAEATVDDTQAVRLDWWNALEDPMLSSLIDKAAAHNLDIKIAEANIREARALRRAEKSGYFPNVNASGISRREGLSENAGVPAGQGAGIPLNRDFYDTGFDASWEIDVFGGVQRSVEAADARLGASIENRRDIILTALAETARNYTELRGTQRRMAITKKNIGLQQKTVEIVCQRYDVGDANEFELQRAKAQLEITQAALPNLNADLRASAYRVSVLTGQEPQALLEDLLESKPLPAPPDVVPVGLRSDILRRRPDVRLAERQLAAEVADIGVAESKLFPSFFLTGDIAQQALSFSDLFTSASTAFALGPLIQWPIFRAGEIRAQIASEEAQADASTYAYEKAVLTALEDAETALVRYGEELETRKRLAKAVASNARAVQLAKQRYERGEDNILSVVDAERELAQVEDGLVHSETRVITNLISLYKALGGGWEKFERDKEQ